VVIKIHYLTYWPRVTGISSRKLACMSSGWRGALALGETPRRRMVLLTGRLASGVAPLRREGPKESVLRCRIFRYSADIANWDSQEIVKFENLWMRSFKKAWKVNASLPDVTFWAGPEQGGLGTPKARAIITSETISLLNQCMRLNDDDK